MQTRQEIISQIKSLLNPQPSLWKGFIQKEDGLWYDIATPGPGMTKAQCMKTYARGRWFIIPASRRVRHAVI